MGPNRKTAHYQVIKTTSGNRYRFFCDLSDAVLCTTKPVRAASPEEELELAWETEGKRHFNCCHKCGRWVSDVMYNADELQCVDCAPWKNPPRYCPHCGDKLEPGQTICAKCGCPIRRREGEEDDKGPKGHP